MVFFTLLPEPRDDEFVLRAVTKPALNRARFAMPGSTARLSDAGPRRRPPAPHVALPPRHAEACSGPANESYPTRASPSLYRSALGGRVGWSWPTDNAASCRCAQQTDSPRKTRGLVAQTDTDTTKALPAMKLTARYHRPITHAEDRGHPLHRARYGCLQRWIPPASWTLVRGQCRGRGRGRALVGGRAGDDRRVGGRGGGRGRGRRRCR